MFQRVLKRTEEFDEEEAKKQKMVKEFDAERSELNNSLKSLYSAVYHGIAVIICHELSREVIKKGIVRTDWLPFTCDEFTKCKGVLHEMLVEEGWPPSIHITFHESVVYVEIQ
jgi:hypothetical protein